MKKKIKKTDSRSDFLCKRKDLLKSKRSQAQIIVTVVIILIVIVILGYVGNWVYKIVKEGSEDVDAKTICLEVNLDIKSAMTSGISIERSAGGPDSVEVLLYVNGMQNVTDNFTQLQTSSLGNNLVIGDQVQVAAKINETICQFSDEATVA